MKICTNCLHCRYVTVPERDSSFHLDAKCHCPKNIETSPVTGLSETIWRTAIGCRTAPAGCGPEGKWYEQKGER